MSDFMKRGVIVEARRADAVGREIDSIAVGVDVRGLEIDVAADRGITGAIGKGGGRAVLVGECHPQVTDGGAALGHFREFEGRRVVPGIERLVEDGAVAAAGGIDAG